MDRWNLFWVGVGVVVLALAVPIVGVERALKIAAGGLALVVSVGVAGLFVAVLGPGSGDEEDGSAS